MWRAWMVRGSLGWWKLGSRGSRRAGQEGWGGGWGRKEGDKMGISRNWGILGKWGKWRKWILMSKRIIWNRADFSLNFLIRLFNCLDNNFLS
jgi:hypothetical protein